MFDLEAAIAEWRRTAKSACTADRSALAELEDHLRETFTALHAAGHGEDDAWRLATTKLGEPAAIGREFAKIERLPVLDRIAFAVMLGVAAISVLGLVTYLFNRDLKSTNSPLLTSHVVVITLGYLAGLFATAMAAYAAVRRLQSRQSTTLLTSVTVRAVRTASLATAALTAVGYALGSIWSSHNLGRAIIGDAREIGAILVIISFSIAATIAGKRRRSDRAALALAILSGGTIMAVWFGAAAWAGGWPLLLTSLGLGGFALSVALAGIALAVRERDLEGVAA